MSSGGGKIDRRLTNSAGPAYPFVGFQAGENHVGESPPQQSEGGNSVLAACSLLVEVRPAWSDATSLGNGDHVQGVVHGPVSSAVEADLAVAGSRPDRDGGGAGEPGEGVLVTEPVDASGLADDQGRGQHTAAGDGEQRRRQLADQVAQLVLQCSDLRLRSWQRSKSSPVS